MHIELQAPLAFYSPLSRSTEVPVTVFCPFPTDLADSEPAGLDIWHHAPNRPLWCIPGSSSPKPSTILSFAFHRPSPSSFGCFLLFSLISSPCGSIFGFAPQTASPCAYRPLGPPSILTHLPLATHKPAPPSSGRSVPFSPISSPCGSIFGFAPQTAPPCSYRPPGPLAFQPASLSQHASSHHPHLVVPHGSH